MADLRSAQFFIPIYRLSLLYVPTPFASQTTTAATTAFGGQLSINKLIHILLCKAFDLPFFGPVWPSIILWHLISLNHCIFQPFLGHTPMGHLFLNHCILNKNSYVKITVFISCYTHSCYIQILTLKKFRVILYKLFEF